MWTPMDWSHSQHCSFVSKQLSQRSGCSWLLFLGRRWATISSISSWSFVSPELTPFLFSSFSFQVVVTCLAVSVWLLPSTTSGCWVCRDGRVSWSELVELATHQSCSSLTGQGGLLSTVSFLAKSSALGFLSPSSLATSSFLLFSFLSSGVFGSRSGLIFSKLQTRLKYSEAVLDIFCQISCWHGTFACCPLLFRFFQFCVESLHF